MRALDLFSAAAGGWSLGLHRAGFETIAACEVIPWRRALYAENNPHVRLYDDVRTLTAERLRADLGRLPDIVVGSPPCQDISSANTKGKGVEGERSGLYFEAIRIIGECRPRWFALENSANLRTRGADAVLAALETIGYACWPLVVRARDVGANHERRRAWLIGCDLRQVADADGIGRHEGWGWGRGGFDVSVSTDIGHAAQDGCGPGLPGRCAEPIERLPEQACGDALDSARVGHEGGRTWRHGPDGHSAAPVDAGDAADTASEGHAGGAALQSGRPAGDQHARDHDAVGAGTMGAGDPAHADQVGQAHGHVEPGLRSTEITDDGRGAGRRADGAGSRQMGLCSSDRGAADRGGPDWSLANLADHLRMDDGLSAGLAGARVDVGDGKGQSAASLLVEAFGDAVIPQIPEAIARAILRTEVALAAIYGKPAA